MTQTVFSSDELLLWFEKNQRPLPWRKPYDPYWVWISEIMLQQTRVDQALPFFDRFITRFPSVNALGKASEQEVLKYWEGLGYYSRARNLHKAAKIVAKKHGGVLPSGYFELLELPGIGPYVAAAVSSIAFNQDHAVLDGNVFRVLARVFGVAVDIRQPSSRKKFQSIADSILPVGRARMFNQALMELGALICVPEVPLCAQCPIKLGCIAFGEARQSEWPVAYKNRARPVRSFAVIRVFQGGRWWLASNEKGLLKGLYSFPLVEYAPLSDSKQVIEEKFFEKFGVRVKLSKEIGSVRHDYTHFRQIAVLFDGVLVSGEKQAVFFSKAEQDALPLTKLQQKLAVL